MAIKASLDFHNIGHLCRHPRQHLPRRWRLQLLRIGAVQRRDRGHGYQHRGHSPHPALRLLRLSDVWPSDVLVGHRGRLYHHRRGYIQRLCQSDERIVW